MKHKWIIEVNHERNKAQAAYLSVMERAPAQESAPQLMRARPFQLQRARSEICSQGRRTFSWGRALFNCKGLFQKFAHRGRALSHEGAPFSIAKGSFRNLLTGGALFLMRARPSCPGGSSRIDQAKIRHSFALKMNVGAGTQFVHR